VAGVHDNLITGNVSNDNGNLGEGAGILIAAALPGGGAWSNRVVGNEANHNSMPGITIHSHTPNQDVNDNVLNGNRLSHDGLGGATGAPGDPDFGPIGTTGILVGSAAGPITGTQITGNHISNVHVGIWTAKVPPDPKLAVTNSFTAVDVPLHQQ
jgi:hypothetical protein